MPEKKDPNTVQKGQNQVPRKDGANAPLGKNSGPGNTTSNKPSSTPPKKK